MLVLVMAIGLLGCGGKNSIGGLKNDKNLLKETIKKCSTGEMNSKAAYCVNAKKVQDEFGKEIWNKNKSEIEEKLKNAAKLIENGEYEHVFDLFPDKVVSYVEKSNDITEKEFK